MIVTGCAHLGKSSLSLFLGNYLRNKIARRFLVFPSNGNLLDINDVKETIILFDDPFGGSEFHYNEIADKFEELRDLSKDNYVIITSRREVLNEAIKHSKLGEQNTKKFVLEIKENDYSSDDFREILRKHLDYYNASDAERKIAHENEQQIIYNLGFPHNYEILVREELRKVVEDNKGIIDAIKDAREIEKVVGKWFSSYFDTNKDVFYFLFTLSLFEHFDEETFSGVHKAIIQQVNENRNCGVALPSVYDLRRLRKITSSYVSQYERIEFEHPSYREGILESMYDEYRAELIGILPVGYELAKDKNWGVRDSVVSYLGEIGKLKPDETLPVLNELAKDGDMWWAVTSAIEKIGKLNPDKIIPVLKEWAIAKDDSVRMIVAHSLGEICKIKPEDALFLLGKLAGDEDIYVRRGVASSLGEINMKKPNKVLDILKSLREDKDVYVRRNATGSLTSLTTFGKEKLNEIQSLLEASLNDGRGDVREIAIYSLVDINKRNPEFILPRLKNLVNDESKKVRMAIVESLDMLWEDRVDDVMFSLWEDRTDEIISILKELLNDRDPKIRWNVLEVLEAICRGYPDKVIPVLGQSAKNSRYIETRCNSIYFLGKFSNIRPSILHSLKEFSKDKNENVRQATAYSLGEVGKSKPDEAFIILKELANDEYQYVRRGVASSLGKISKIKPKDTLMVLKDLIKDRKWTVRESVVYSLTELAKIKSDQILPILEELTKDRSWKVRIAIINVINEINESERKKFVPILNELIKDKDNRVQEKAIYTLNS